MRGIDRRSLLGAGMIALPMPLSAQSPAPAVPVQRFGATGGARGTLVLIYGSDGVTNPGRYHLAAQMLAGLGYTVLMPDYFRATGDSRARYGDIRSKFPDWLAAIEGVLSTLPGGRIGIVGFSLGGALALALGARNPRVAAVVNFFGFISEGLERATRLAPTLILHGAADRVVPVSNATAIERVLASRGVPVELQIYPGEGHGLSAAAFPDAIARTRDFLQRNL